VTNEIPRTPFKSPTNVANWLLSSGIFGACVALSYLIGEGRGWAAGSAIGALALLTQVSWPLRKEPWFWLIVAALAGVHVWGVLCFDWSWVFWKERA